MTTRILETHELPYAEIHLDWLREHKPEYLRTLHHENKLKEYLTNLINPYLYQAATWSKQGLNNDQIDEMINDQISPYIEPNENPEPEINYREFQKILDKLYLEE